MRLHLRLVKIETLPPVGSLEMLREFLYEGNTNKVVSVISLFMTSFASAPRLRTVTIIDNRTWAWVLHWANLTSLTMTCDTMVFQLDIMPRICESFQACVCLEFLDLKLNHLSHEPLVPSQIPVVLP